MIKFRGKKEWTQFVEKKQKCINKETKKRTMKRGILLLLHEKHVLSTPIQVVILVFFSFFSAPLTAKTLGQLFSAGQESLRNAVHVTCH